jgi:glycosyltransferase involved in cell wall biosynthesis
MCSVIVAYSGVHQAYQIALAAQEIEQLERFYCSLFDAPGTWGDRISHMFGADVMLNRRQPEIPVSKVVEYPWPFLKYQIGTRLKLRAPHTWTQASKEFDHWVAHHLRGCDSHIFVGVETCACESLKVAKGRGMVTVLDCPGAHPTFVESILCAAAEDLELSPPGPIDPPDVAARKREEFRIADFLLVLSDVERRSYLEAGIADSRLVQIPLWAEPELWFPLPYKPRLEVHRPLQALYVGGIRLQKGVPYLLQAVQQCSSEVQLTLVGQNSGDVELHLRLYEDCYEHIQPQSKTRLREIYQNSDVLILPSLCDTFGFVAMEAMACGIPVIVSENCGVPVPDEAWRVPVMNSEAIAERLLIYARNRELCYEDGQRAAKFARQWTPNVYRSQVAAFLNQLQN